MMKCGKCGHALPEDSLFCQHCGSRVEREQQNVSENGAFVLRDPTAPRREVPQAYRDSGKKASGFSAVDVLTIVLYILTAVCAVVAMNLQDTRRNTMEAISPTALYLFLIGMCAIGLLFFFLSRKVRFPLAQYVFCGIPVLFAIVVLIEGSLFGDTYVSGQTTKLYANHDLISILNTVWIIAVFAIASVNVAPLTANVQARWRVSLLYRERRYEKVAKMKGYLDSGIINREEYEKYKEDILKDIRQ